MKYPHVLWLMLLSFSTLLAQEKSGVKTVIGAGATQTENLGHVISTPVNGVNTTVNINSVHILTGMPYMGVIDAPYANNPTQNYIKDLGFPWDIRYRYNTFSEDAFTVSKGYYSDRIELNWLIKANQDKVTSISVYRTQDVSSANPSWGTPIKTLAADAGTFVDTNIEGGKLYRYKLAARGVEADGVEIPYSTFITGIGYRNPTGIITGTISYAGGTPVKNVLVTANPTGAQLNFGSSLKIQSNGHLLISKLHENLKDAVTLQAWIKPETSFYATPVTLYQLYSGLSDTFESSAVMTQEGNTNKLSINVGNYNMTLTDYIPSGEVNNKGDDILVPITNMNSSFTHLSMVLRDNKLPEIYINGRLISADYAVTMNDLLAQNIDTAGETVAFTSNNQTINLNTSTNGSPHTWDYFRVGGGNTTYFDDLRVWSTALEANVIFRDFRRYLKGNETNLHTYIRANEGTGDYAYDLAHTGYDFHGNDARLSNAPVPATWANEPENIPTSTQLGILGVTDEYGNYEISSVPYSGNGESFTIVPSLGKHEFNPTQELAFIGGSSAVVNNMDFIDQSSFTFKGNVVYDSRGVFPPTSDSPITGDIKDNEFYNAYTVGNLKYQKGEYWAEKDAQGNITHLLRYAKIPVTKANVFIDGIQAMDANNVPVQTDINGQFTIEVPIGKHAISVSKASHEFEFSGRYPAIESTVINGETYETNTYVDFYQDSDEPVTFIDNTKTIVVGRVVGGLVQADKAIGFGFNGIKAYDYNEIKTTLTGTDTIPRHEIYTSINNIGSAKLTLGYMPVGATSITPEYQTSFSTNSETGEFRVSLLPLNYMLTQNNISFYSGVNPNDQPILSADMTLNYTQIKPLQYPSVTINDETITGADPYQEVLKFTHIAPPENYVITQTSDTAVDVDGISYDISPDQSPLIYNQLRDYTIKIRSVERYENFDDSTDPDPRVDFVPVTGNTLIVTNNIALEGTENITTSPTDSAVTLYTFKGGFPNTDADTNYERTIDLKMRVNNIDYPVDGYDPKGILLGGRSDGTQTFVTAGPEQTDIILRDPPGSTSKATIEQGAVFTFSQKANFVQNASIENKASVFIGGTFETGGGLAGPVNKIETKNATSINATVEQKSSYGSEIETTYTFNQSISTSDEPLWVGSEADLYIGKSTNYYYGTYDNLTLTDSIRYFNAAAAIQVIDSTGAELSLYPKLVKALYFSESPEKTYFMYTQKTILEEIIPRYEGILLKLASGELVANQGDVKDATFYKSSIKLWRQAILKNEATKYKAFTNRSGLKSSIHDRLEKLPDGTEKEALASLLNDSFYQNISFDSGTGEFTQSTEVERITSESFSFEVTLDVSVSNSLGLEYNDVGFENEFTTAYGAGGGVEDERSIGNSKNVSFSFSDYDEFNTYSVDVINAFDGNGPIFITRGGQTSCPYEPEEKSHFYNPNHPNVTDSGSDIVPLGLDKREDLSYATAALEKPELTVEVASVTNVPEGRNAEFVLRLRNTSAIENEALFNLQVDPTTNPYNSEINIDSDGQQFLLKSGETVEFTMTLSKVVEDQFDYENIRIYLESACGNAERNLSLIGVGNNLKGEVFVSASFVPACSPVSITAPANNWEMNKNVAYDGANTNPLLITIGEYNTNFASFKQLNLEYRLKGTPNWVGLKTYYKNQEDYDLALAGGDTNIALIDAAELNYA